MPRKCILKLKIQKFPSQVRDYRLLLFLLCAGHGLLGHIRAETPGPSKVPHHRVRVELEDREVGIRAQFQ